MCWLMKKSYLRGVRYLPLSFSALRYICGEQKITSQTCDFRCYSPKLDRKENNLYPGKAHCRSCVRDYFCPMEGGSLSRTSAQNFSLRESRSCYFKLFQLYTDGEWTLVSDVVVHVQQLKLLNVCQSIYTVVFRLHLPNDKTLFICTVFQ